MANKVSRASKTVHPNGIRNFLYRLVAAAAFLSVSEPVFAKPDVAGEKPREIVIRARTIDSFDRDQPQQRAFGRLTFLGGLSLSSSAKLFGGFSGLALDKNGTRFLSVSDAGFWMTGALVYDGDKLKGIENARNGPLLALNGRDLERDEDRDAESVTMIAGDVASGTALIAFERNHRIGYFGVNAEGVAAPKSYVKLPGYISRLQANRGLETVAVLGIKGGGTQILAISESRRDSRNFIRGWLIGGKRSGEIFIEPREGFDITDAAVLPDGNVVLLERRFRWSEGVQMQMRLIRARDIRPGAVLKGEILFSGDQRYSIDNMEGIAAHLDAKGRTILTLISDDNFSFFQRTLVLQFRLD